MVQGAVDAFLEDTVTLAAGSVHEVQFSIAAGESFVWDWSGDDHVAFSIHEGSTQLFERHTRGENGNITAPQAATYRVVWDNQEPDAVTLALRLWGNFALLP
jgi:hypothetical protein